MPGFVRTGTSRSVTAESDVLISETQYDHELAVFEAQSSCSVGQFSLVVCT